MPAVAIALYRQMVQPCWTEGVSLTAGLFAASSEVHHLGTEAIATDLTLQSGHDKEAACSFSGEIEAIADAARQVTSGVKSSEGLRRGAAAGGAVAGSSTGCAHNLRCIPHLSLCHFLRAGALGHSSSGRFHSCRKPWSSLMQIKYLMPV